MEMAKKII